VIFDPTAEFMVTPAMLHHRHKITPYEGRTLRGRVEKTFLRGRKVFDTGSLSHTAAGRALLRAEGLKHD
jgi:allantoinase